MSPEEILKAKKSEYLKLGEEIDALRQSIADSKCPFKIGETIICNDGERDVSFVIEKIFGTSSTQEIPLPVVDAIPTWSVFGHRINKTDGKISHSHTYTVNEYEIVEKDGNNIKIKKWGLNELFGIPND